jgi:solute carrier family 25 folate transporter 32
VRLHIQGKFFLTDLDNPNVINFGSSIVAGGISTLVTNPIWVIKTRLMAQVSRRSQSNGARPPWHYSSTFDAARKMYQTEGFLSFYSGLTPALLGLTHVAVQFPAYEYLKTKFTGQGMGVHGDGSERSHWLGILSASVLSKILASSATYPHEVIRTRLQTQLRSIPPVLDSHGVPKTPNIGQTVGPKYKGIVTTFKTILREEGWRAFYAGMGTNMMRAVPAATTTLLTYEYVSSNLQHIKRDALHRAGKADGEDW